MKFRRIAGVIPSWKSALLAVISAILLILAFPDFEYWFLAWFALGPFLVAIEREKTSIGRGFVLGWIWGVVFFFGTCWWLTYAPIHYAAFPWPLAYFLLFWVVAAAAVFPGIFSAVTSYLIRWFGGRAFLAVPFVWVASEFARSWITGNDWNAIGYSQFTKASISMYASIGGVLAVSFAVVFYNLVARILTLIGVAVGIEIFRWLRGGEGEGNAHEESEEMNERQMFALVNDNPDEVRNTLIVGGVIVFYILLAILMPGDSTLAASHSRVIAVQPNVPMSGLDSSKWTELRDRQIAMAESELSRNKGEGASDRGQVKTTVILPESPMNYQWDEDPEFQRFISDFAARNNVSVLFNSAEPDPENHKYFNSAVMIDPTGREVAEYDKIYLLPFGEAVPVPLESLVPGFVGNFSYGKNYNLVPLGDAKAGIMICFESHFGQLSREYVRRGADAIIEMTNDGYLGPTPVLRQHLANAVFRAIETNRPVLRVTNVGITAYITERGEVLDPTRPYTEDTRVWSVAKSDGSQTFYVKYGDWFAWLCSVVTIGLLIMSFFKSRRSAITG